MDTSTSTGSRFSEVQVSMDAAKTFTSTCTSMHFKCNFHLYISTRFFVFVFVSVLVVEQMQS